MYNLKDCTFLIPIKVDQKERLRNFYILIRYLKKYLDTNIIVGEAGLKEYNNGEIKNNLMSGCRYIFIPETSEYFHRMKVINTLSTQVNTTVIAIQDTDVLLYPEQYIEALEKILNFGYDLVYPYSGDFYSVPEKFVGDIGKNLDISFIDVKQCKNMRPEGNSVGGVLFWNFKKFKEFGGCNEKFISWGYDDTEIYERACKLGAKVYRCKRGLIHLNHGTSLNSLNGNHKYYKNNEQEWLKIKNMNNTQLIEYIKTWRYLKNV